MSMAASPPAYNRAGSRSLILVMGVSGCGKSSVGAMLAARLGLAFVEGDMLHPPANVEKMSQGVALSDADRWPWLDKVRGAFSAAEGAGVVVTCSALKASYRDHLRRAANGDLQIVFLHGANTVLQRR